MADYRKRLAERLENEREAKSFSRETLALKAGVSDKTIKRIEEQRVERPRPVTIRRLADALGIEPSSLAPPEELEADQLNRIEQKLDRLLAWAEGRTVEEVEAEFGLDADQEPRPGEAADG
jgi:transcriptional regulator with XRE-family HTH domain